MDLASGRKKGSSSRSSNTSTTTASLLAVPSYIYIYYKGERKTTKIQGKSDKEWKERKKL